MKQILSLSLIVCIILIVVYMASLPIKEVESLNILGFHLDHQSTMINQLSTCRQQWVRALYCVKDWLGPKSRVIVSKSFTVCKYGSIAFMGAPFVRV